MDNTDKRSLILELNYVFSDHHMVSEYINGAELNDKVRMFYDIKEGKLSLVFLDSKYYFNLLLRGGADAFRADVEAWGKKKKERIF